MLVSIGSLWLAFAYPASSAVPTGAQVAASDSNPTPTGYTVTYVAKHSTAKDCWLIVRGSVYNVSPYIGNHPGGARAITDRCGLEVSSIFSAIHSNRAWDLLGAYRIGAIGTSTPTTSTSSVNAVTKVVKAAFPDSDVLRVQPYGTGYLALVATNNVLYDVVLDEKGGVISQQARNDEFEWFWNADDSEVEEWQAEQN